MGSKTSSCDRSTPVTQEARQFFKLSATIPDQPTPSGAHAGDVTGGVMSDRLSRGESGLAFPLIAADAFVGVAIANADEPGGSSRVRVEFDAGHGAIAGGSTRGGSTTPKS